MLLRGLTATTGAIHEAQLLQLRYWGGLAFTGEWSADVDAKGKTVTYVLAKTPRKDLKRLARVVAGLDRSVHWLLGPEWGLNVKAKDTGNLLYAGQRKKVDVDEQRKQRAEDPGGGGPPERS